MKSSDATSESHASQILSRLHPGSILLATNDHFQDDLPGRNPSPLVLSSFAAIHITLKELAGYNVIELDLQDRLEKLLPAIAPEYVNVFVTDATSRIPMDYRQGRFVEIVGAQSILAEFPKLSPLFDEDLRIRVLGDSRLYYAKLVRLGKAPSRAQVGIATHVIQE